MCVCVKILTVLIAGIQFFNESTFNQRECSSLLLEDRPNRVSRFTYFKEKNISEWSSLISLFF